MSAEVLVRAQVFDSKLRRYLDHLLRKEVEESRLSDFRVYKTQEDPLPEVDDLNLSTCSTQGSSNFEDLKVKLYHGSLQAMVIIRRISSHHPLNSDLCKLPWIQSSMFYCPSCQNFTVLDKNQQLSSHLKSVSLQAKGTAKSWTISNVLALLEDKEARLSESIPSSLQLLVQKYIKSIWTNSFQQQDFLKEFTRKWIRHYFSGSSFLSVGRDLIKLNIIFSFDSKEQISQKIEIFENLVGQFNSSPHMSSDFYYRVVGFLMCMIGNSKPNQLSKEDYFYFNELKNFFLSTEEVKRLDADLQFSIDENFYSVVKSLEHLKLLHDDLFLSQNDRMMEEPIDSENSIMSHTSSSLESWINPAEGESLKGSLDLSESSYREDRQLDQEEGDCFLEAL